MRTTLFITSVLNIQTSAEIFQIKNVFSFSWSTFHSTFQQKSEIDVLNLNGKIIELFETSCYEFDP